MKMKLSIITCLLLGQICLSQVKGKSSPISFNGKSANAFSIELPQNLEYVQQLFNSKFELERFGSSKISHDNFNVYFQVKAPSISGSFLDFYYLLEEIKSDNGTSVKITLLMSKGYDNFISQETDRMASQSILEALNEIGLSVQRKNYEILIGKTEQEIQMEKQKLLLIEGELRALLSEKNELDSNIDKTNLILTSQAKLTQELGNGLQNLKNTLSDFEKRTSHKSKATLKSVSKL